ncbi:hypothetical protein [Brevundimonas sp.]|uniref:hypothetical protein n=1 Tax=Brevundimonas sp. TaxID=1871086 RepID=UPI0037C000DE
MMRAATTGLGWLRPAGWGLVALALLTPLVAMQFTREVAWTASDFLFAAGLLVGAGLLIELAVLKVRNRTGAAIIAGVVVLAVLLIWAQGAVGIF